MKTTINNDERIFMVQSKPFTMSPVFCNLADLPKVFEHFRGEEKVTIKHCWNGKFVRASKKLLNDMFDAHSINYKVK